MVAVVLKLRMLPGESPERFASRKQRAISHEIPPFKSWSYIWASRVESWAQHIVRNTFNRVWTARIAEFRNAEELEARRLANPSRRPDTRVCSGFTAVRWYASIDAACRFIVVQDERSESLALRLRAGRSREQGL